MSDKAAGAHIAVDTRTFYFPPPLNRAIENVLELSSSSDAVITYKLKTSAPNSYAVKKRTGFINPHSKEKIHITFRGQDEPTTQPRKDRFQLEVRYLAADGSEDKAYKAISSQAPGQEPSNDLVSAIAALNATAKPGQAPLPSSSNASDVLGWMWKAQGIKDRKQDILLFDCKFDALPGSMSEKRRNDTSSEATESQGAMSTVRGAPDESAKSSASRTSDSIESLQQQIKASKEENRKLQQTNEELRKSQVNASVQQGLPLWMAALVALLSLAAGYLLGPSA